ncbi:MAG: hypothetical protein K2N41_09805, partial [Lachnospiraceae bacterium]|nr:hypothetical protein [Lachnospiraceae bacterium]
KKQILTSIVNQTNSRRAQFPDLEQVSAYIGRRKNRMEAEDETIEAGTGMDVEYAAAGTGTGMDEHAAAETGADMDGEYAATETENRTKAVHTAGQETDRDMEDAADEIWEEYCEACRELGGLDFEDITGLCGRLLRD